MRKNDWVKLPTGWIQERRLTELRWASQKGSNNIAALMVLIVIAHHAQQQDGEIKQLTYNQLETATELSRPKISAGLAVLESSGLIGRSLIGRSSFKLLDFDPTQSWGKLPFKSLYAGERVPFFAEMHLRKLVELDALKLLLLIVARRDNSHNQALMTYQTIEAYSGIDRNRIRAAISMLVVNGLVHVDRVLSEVSEFGVANAYRLTHIDSRMHAGTTGRRTDQIIELEDLF